MARCYASPEARHNAFRAAGDEADDGAAPGRYNPSELILATEEADAPPDCNNLGQFAIASLEGSHDGEACWRSTGKQKLRLKTVGTWNPHDQEGTLVNKTIYCSAHYFDAQDGILAYSWYDQGTRFVDVTDPTTRSRSATTGPTTASPGRPYFHNGYVYVADHGRGVDILKLATGAKSGRDVVAPTSSARHRRLVAKASRGLRADPVLGWMCPLPRR